MAGEVGGFTGAQTLVTIVAIRPGGTPSAEESAAANLWNATPMGSPTFGETTFSVGSFEAPRGSDAIGSFVPNYPGDYIRTDEWDANVHFDPDFNPKDILRVPCTVRQLYQKADGLTNNAKWQGTAFMVSYVEPEQVEGQDGPLIVTSRWRWKGTDLAHTVAS